MTRAIVSVAVGERYAPFGTRLEQSLLMYGAADLVRVWREWPPGSPSHQEMHYAFKAFAVKQAVDVGYRYVMWLDAGCKAVGPMEPLWQVVERDGYYFSSGDRMPLGEWISDRGLAHFSMLRDDAMNLQVFGGTPVALDMARPECVDFLTEWLELARTGLFMSCHTEYLPDRMRSLSVVDGSRGEIVSLDPRVKGHLSDEACFSLMAHKRGMRGTVGGLFNGPEGVACVRSGYDAI